MIDSMRVKSEECGDERWISKWRLWSWSFILHGVNLLIYFRHLLLNEHLTSALASTSHRETQKLCLQIFLYPYSTYFWSLAVSIWFVQLASCFDGSSLFMAGQNVFFLNVKCVYLCMMVSVDRLWPITTRHRLWDNLCFI